MYIHKFVCLQWADIYVYVTTVLFTFSFAFKFLFAFPFCIQAVIARTNNMNDDNNTNINISSNLNNNFSRVFHRTHTFHAHRPFWAIEIQSRREEKLKQFQWLFTSNFVVLCFVCVLYLLFHLKSLFFGKLLLLYLSGEFCSVSSIKRL